jgi:hypothetical protein
MHGQTSNRKDDLWRSGLGIAEHGGDRGREGGSRLCAFRVHEAMKEALLAHHLTCPLPLYLLQVRHRRLHQLRR